MRLAAHHLSLRFGAVNALSQISMEFSEGSRAVLWGPAGGGKTSLLKCLAGLIAPTAGEVLWNGEVAASLSAEKKRAAQVNFGMVFQTDALFDSLTVLDNVLLPLRKRGVPADEANKRAREALERVGLSHALDRRPENLSGGMKKRCGVARAIVARPAVLLADDPFAGLDPKTEKSIADLLMEVSEGRTLIVALPDPVDSLPISRTLRLVAGSIVTPSLESAA